MKRGLASSRQRARELIEEGRVKVDGIVATRPAMQVRPDRPIEIVGDETQWVGRGALKLLGALQTMPATTEGVVAADLGASTGGFTEVLLSRGAVKVYAIDVGRGQLAWSLRTDERVVVMDGVNARHLEGLPEPMDLVVGDLSFISLSHILPTVRRLLRVGGQALLLVKPQFEVGRDAVGKGGLVRDEAAREASIARVQSLAAELGFVVLGGADCVVAGAKAGNVEYFLFLEASGGEPQGVVST